MPLFSPGAILGAQTVSAYQISRSLRFRSSASAYLSRTFTSGNRQTWTWSAWVKRGAISQRVGLFGQRASDTPGFNIEIQADNTLAAFSSGDSGAFTIITTPVFRDPSAWYHIVFSVNTTLSSGRCVVYVNGVSQALATNTTSLNYNTGLNTTNQHEIGRLGATVLSPFDGYLAEVNFIDGQALDPTSFGAYDTTTGVWGPKAYTGTYGTNGFYLPFSNNSSANTLCYDMAGSNTVVSSAAYFTPTGGVSQSSLNFNGTATIYQLFDGVTTGQTTIVNNPVNSYLQVDAGSGNTLDLTKWGFYLRNALTSETWSIQYSDDASTWTNAKTGFQVSAAGWNDTTFTSVGAHRYWRAIVTTQVNGEYYTEYRLYGTGTYRTANDWTPANISTSSGTTYDSMIDTPTPYADGGNGRGNYAVWNPLILAKNFDSNTQIIADGNLVSKFTSNTTAGKFGGASTIGVNSGKWYCEIAVVGSSTYGAYTNFGVTGDPWYNSVTTNASIGQQDYSVGWYNASGVVYRNGSVVFTGSTVSSPYTAMIALDIAAGKVYFGFNETWINSADPSAGTGGFSLLAVSSTPTGRYFISCFFASTGMQGSYTLNAGQQPFSYTPPSGYSALNTQNLPAPALTPSP